MGVRSYSTSSHNSTRNSTKWSNSKSQAITKVAGWGSTKTGASAFCGSLRGVKLVQEFPLLVLATFCRVCGCDLQVEACLIDLPFQVFRRARQNFPQWSVKMCMVEMDANAFPPNFHDRAVSIVDTSGWMNLPLTLLAAVEGSKHSLRPVISYLSWNNHTETDHQKYLCHQCQPQPPAWGASETVQARIWYCAIQSSFLTSMSSIAAYSVWPKALSELGPHKVWKFDGYCMVRTDNSTRKCCECRRAGRSHVRHL